LLGIASWHIRCVNSLSYVAVRLLRHVAADETNQDASDRLKLGGVDERVGADVEKHEGHRDVVTVVDERDAVDTKNDEQEIYYTLYMLPDSPDGV